jgi:multidrug efflux pump subunit AcrA (membrane-fusion protein)
MFAEAQLTLAMKTAVLTVPQSAIQSDAGSTYVYAIESGKLVQRPVTLGLRGHDDEGAAVEVVKGLENGVQIVKTNLGTLRAGTVVRFPQAASPTAAIGAASK